MKGEDFDKGWYLLEGENCNLIFSSEEVISSARETGYSLGFSATGFFVTSSTPLPSSCNGEDISIGRIEWDSRGSKQCMQIAVRQRCG